MTKLLLAVLLVEFGAVVPLVAKPAIDARPPIEVKVRKPIWHPV